MTTSFEPLELVGATLSNRIVMSPMTRSRAYGPGRAPTDATPSTTPSARRPA